MSAPIFPDVGITPPSDPPKPCDLPCEKCGHPDIHRVFRTCGSSWHLATDKYGKPENRYGTAQAYTAYSTRDHIDHICRCCGYRWQTLPLPKPRKKRAKSREET